MFSYAEKDQKTKISETTAARELHRIHNNFILALDVYPDEKPDRRQQTKRVVIYLHFIVAIHFILRHIAQVFSDTRIHNASEYDVERV